MIAIVTDSASMLPSRLRDRYDVAVVPITISLDGVEHTEGVDLGTAEFYERLAGGATVTTSAPSPGRFVETYRAVAAAGATEILSVHTGSAYSATVASARIAADLVDVPVTIVDTEVASFPVAMAVWSAAEIVIDGGSIGDAAVAARTTAKDVGSLFVVGVPEVARRGGRFVAIADDLTPTTVLRLSDGQLDVCATVRDVSAAIDVMVERTLVDADVQPLRVGVGHAALPDVAAALVSRLVDRPGIVATTTYEIGPSVGAHTGPGTFGVVYAASPL